MKLFTSLLRLVMVPGTNVTFLNRVLLHFSLFVCNYQVYLRA